MEKIIIFGNSGSGKSTLATQLSKTKCLPHFDLDTVAWQPTTPPQRKAIADSKQAIDEFTEKNNGWIIEGCYSDLLELVLTQATQIIFLNLPIEVCIANAKNRPWEPHKYESKSAQDKNLPMLLEWIAQYNERNDTFSKTAHEKLFKQYKGRKTMYKDNLRTA